MRFSLIKCLLFLFTDNITAFYKPMIAVTTLFRINKKSLPILVQSPIDGTLNVL